MTSLKECASIFSIFRAARDQITEHHGGGDRRLGGRGRQAHRPARLARLHRISRGVRADVPRAVILARLAGIGRIARLHPPGDNSHGTATKSGSGGWDDEEDDEDAGWDEGDSWQPGPSTPNPPKPARTAVSAGGRRIEGMGSKGSRSGAACLRTSRYLRRGIICGGVLAIVVMGAAAYRYIADGGDGLHSKHLDVEFELDDQAGRSSSFGSGHRRRASVCRGAPRSRGWRIPTRVPASTAIDHPRIETPSSSRKVPATKDPRRSAPPRPRSRKPRPRRRPRR